VSAGVLRSCGHDSIAVTHIHLAFMTGGPPGLNEGTTEFKAALE
jgi:hypothetical protein